MSIIILMAESGSDISPELAKEYDIEIVPMHVAFGGETRDDGSFPVTEMFDHYKKTHEPPRTSGCTPHDFEMAYAKVDEACADKQVLYLAYSAVTTCSMQSGVIARGDREDITIIDTKNVSAGQAAVVLRVAKYLKAHSEATMEELVAVANEAIEKVAMFTALYEEYARNPDITRSRMYYEAISEILPDVKLFINTGDGANVQSLLPLDSLVTANGGEN